MSKKFQGLPKTKTEKMKSWLWLGLWIFQSYFTQAMKKSQDAMVRIIKCLKTYGEW